MARMGEWQEKLIDGKASYELRAGILLLRVAIDSGQWILLQTDTVTSDTWRHVDEGRETAYGIGCANQACRAAEEAGLKHLASMSRSIAYSIEVLAVAGKST